MPTTSADPFVHLHVASGYSLRYGANSPQALVERAAELEMDTLALTDRNGTYGAVRFVKACQQAGIRPILGVDLAVAQQAQVSASRTPARGGAFRYEHPHRLCFLANGARGWAAICRLVSAAHARIDRRSPQGHEEPWCTPEMIAEHIAGNDVIVLLGAQSDLGEAIARRRNDLAQQILRQWHSLLGDALVVELVSHLLLDSSTQAARMLGLAIAEGIPSVLTNAVRYADRLDAPTVDVLDASRRLVALDARHVDRSNAEGYVKSGKQMRAIAQKICAKAGLAEDAALALLARTRTIADRCALDPRSDLGIGEVHFPELDGVRHPDIALRSRCEAAIGWRYGNAPRQRIWKRLDDELNTIAELGYASYFLAVSEVTEVIKGLGIRRAARGSGAGSLVNYLLGISGVDPIRHGLLMERFLSPLRRSLPDIDIDVESARRLEVYDAIMDRYGPQRCAMVSMMDTYRVRHAIRDVGASLGMPPGEIDAIAKAFPHIRARDARVALRELPELRHTAMAKDAQAGQWGTFDRFFRLVESLDGLPRHIAMHPCGVLLSDVTLLDRTPVEESSMGYPMSQFDKDDVEELGLLKLDVLGIRMQSAMAHAVQMIEEVDGRQIDLDDREQVPFDDPTTYSLISSAKTLGIFQIESPGQRELVGKSGIENFEEIITDISLFRPGPVKSDMIKPYLEVKQGWSLPSYIHDDLRPILGSTHGVVVYHEQVIELISQISGCTLAEADEARRALSSKEGIADIKAWFFPRGLERGYSTSVVGQVWKVLEAFASFGFCKAHAAAFALPTFQSAWLKTHWPAHFLSGVLTHDPGMYPKRLILDDARQLGIDILGLDINASGKEYRVEPSLDAPSGYGIRLALGDIRGISDDEIGQILAARRAETSFTSVSDFWQRARVSRPVAERLVLAGAFDQVHGIGADHMRRRHQLTRRDLLLQVSDLERLQRSGNSRSTRRSRGLCAGPRAVSQKEPRSYQLAFDLGEGHEASSGLPEMTDSDRVNAELDILGVDASRHVVDFHAEFLERLGIVRSERLLDQKNRGEILVAGVKVATQTPPIRSGRRVIFLTLDDSTGPVDATFFEDIQGNAAMTVFGSWLLVVRGYVRRTGRRGVSLRATGVWDLVELSELWRHEGIDAVHARVREDFTTAPESSSQPRRVLVHSSGFRQSPYADIQPAGDTPNAVTSEVARKLWHRSPGSAG